MTTVYKLTDQDLKTYGGFQWEVGKKYTTSGQGSLCGPGWLHAYEHPLLAVFHNPGGANIVNPRLFEASGGNILRDGQMKCGVTELTLIREIPLPAVSVEHVVRYAIGCALAVYRDARFVAWATAWLDGSNREASARASPVWEARAAQAAREAAREAWEAPARAAQAAWEAAREARSIDLIVIAEWAITEQPRRPREN